ncbi:hypothetical protein CPAR01_01858 [Colletotrichum paranaense]|uniref:Xylanolytic transcriptional activator regulatory domain-containing protein n=1 Tax=Colletotrichum paranaense TaxID=1914294 RepID=A0ABQ9T7X0_9PEZI|nr:uncharacterized protein CPAR01_01858 [Colletotrichum paranaense]KAK1547891.1 hypothetical protein CPAR01_01858 [Colletotrichum paranaense]
MDLKRAPDSTPRLFRRARAYVPHHMRSSESLFYPLSSGRGCSADAKIAGVRKYAVRAVNRANDVHGGAPHQRLFEKEHSVSAEQLSEPEQAPVTSPQRQYEAVASTNDENLPVNSAVICASQRGARTASVGPMSYSRPAEGESRDREQSQRPRNSLIGSDFAFIQDSQSSLFLFLGPTSTWTFCRRVFTILENAVGSPDTPLAPLNLDGTAFSLQWQPKLQVDADDLLRLPPMDHALFLTSRAKKTLNGAYLAARALSLLPDVAFLQNKRPALLAIRVLALSALYLHAIDMRSSAYQYIGQAFRLALHDGLHRRMPKDVGPKLIAEFSNTWWGIYVLDQEISAGLGCPSTLSQDYITTSTPDLLSSDHSEKALSLRVRLSRLVLTITSCSYSFDQESVSDFVRDTTSNLHSLAELSQDIDRIISFYRVNGGEPPQMFININLSYHHCIVLATRPLMIWLLTRKFCPGVEPEWLTGPGATLIEKSGRSAAAILSALDDLAQIEMIEAFLPFHLECAFSAATLLSILSAFLPSHIPQSGWRQSVVVVFEALICKGSVAAGLRQAELKHLDTLLAPHRTEESASERSYLPIEPSRLDPSTLGRSCDGRASDGQGQKDWAPVNSYPDATGLGTGLWDFADFCVGSEDILTLAREFELNDPIPWLLPADTVRYM